MKLNEIIARELKRAGRGATVTNVPESRKASADSLAKLEMRIASEISENVAMSARSITKASGMAVK